MIELGRRDLPAETNEWIQRLQTPLPVNFVILLLDALAATVEVDRDDE